MKARAWFVAGAAWVAGVALAADDPRGEPILERCLVSLVDESDVPAEEAGVIVELLVREGDVVQRGKPIARLKDAQPQAELDKARAELAQAEAKAASDVDVQFHTKSEGVALSIYQKNLASNEASKGSVAPVDLERYKLEYEKCGLQIRQAELERKLAQLAVDAKKVEVRAAENAVERRVIRSPIDGKVEKVTKHLGEWMQPGERLAHVARSDTLRVEGYVDASTWRADEIEGREVTVEADVGNGGRETFTGRIHFVSQIDESGREYRVSAEVANRRGAAGGAGEGAWLLRAGQEGARMTIHTQGPPRK